MTDKALETALSYITEQSQQIIRLQKEVDFFRKAFPNAAKNYQLALAKEKKALEKENELGETK